MILHQTILMSSTPRGDEYLSLIFVHRQSGKMLGVDCFMSCAIIMKQFCFLLQVRDFPHDKCFPFYLRYGKEFYTILKATDSLEQLFHVLCYFNKTICFPLGSRGFLTPLIFFRFYYKTTLKMA